MIAALGTTTAADGVRARAAPTQFDELFAGVDDLIHRVADAESPEIRKIRAKVYAAMVAAKNAVEAGTQQHAATALAEITPLADGRNGLLRGAPAHDSPGQGLGVALLLGLGLGLIVSLRQEG